MKDISIYFSDFYSNDNFEEDQIGAKVNFSSAKDFILPSANSIALLFVPEYRNSAEPFSEKNSEWINQFRESFYNLYNGDWTNEFFDLGVIQPGLEISDTYNALKEVVSELVKNDVLPIVIGGTQDLTYAVYQAYEKLEQTINVISVDPGLDLGDVESPIGADAWLNKLMLHKPNYLFNYSLLGYQSYLVPKPQLDLMEQLYFDTFRLGEYYGNAKFVEPLIRNADLFSFDMNAIRSSDYQNNNKFLPNGFYGEDACKIMRYAGFSDKLTSLGIFNFNNRSIDSKNDLNLMAQMLWYFIEGYNQRKNDYPIGSKVNYIKYSVSLDDFKDEIVFYKSNKSGRWWMEVPYPKSIGSKYQRHLLVPCNYEDYQNALKNDVPNLWYHAFKKLT
ncbi:formimidoylglutamase [Crocinitomix catalasitica]|uniref:formimidoylglutamase n=1 Tax=Crocinitomix catalasitica TaxID=184607 RepID=UPI000683DB8D|nr:formimidoylglutamase [Crocinitomix catalasitica]